MVDQGDFGHARPNPFLAPSTLAMFFCDPYLKLCSLLGDSPRQETRATKLLLCSSGP